MLRILVLRWHRFVNHRYGKRHVGDGYPYTHDTQPLKWSDT